MKKKLLIIFMLVLTVFIFNSKNVYAADPEIAWPKSFTSEDYDYTIEGVLLKIYKIDNSKTTTTTTTDEDGGTLTVTTNEDALAYIKGNPTSTISLNANDFTIDPEVSNEKLGDVNGTLVDLKLNLTKEKLTTILADELESTTKDISFMFEVVVNYKLDRYPTNYTHFLNFNIMRFMMGAVTDLATSETISFDGSVDINNTISQVINYGEITQDEAGEVKFTYDTELTDQNGLMAYVFNPLILSEEEVKTELTGEEKNDPTKAHYLYFHYMDNIQYLIDNLNKVEETTEEEANDTVHDTISEQEVQVPNTAMNSSTIWIMLGVVTFLSGIIIILYTLKMIQFRKQKTIS